MLGHNKQPVCIIKVFNEQNQPILNATFFIKKSLDDRGQKLQVRLDRGLGLYYVLDQLEGEYILKVQHQGYETELQPIKFTTRKKQELVFVLTAEEKQGESPKQSIIQGGKRRKVRSMEEERLVVKMKPGMLPEERKELEERIKRLGLEEVEGPQIGPNTKQFKLPKDKSLKTKEAEIQKVLEQEEGVEKFGAVVEAENHHLTMLTAEIIVKFRNHVTEDQIQEFLQRHQLEIGRKLPYGINLFLLKSTTLSNQELLNLSNELQFDPVVESLDSNTASVAQLDLVNPNDFLAQEQWDHVKLINTPDAWQRLQNTSGKTFGNLNVIIAVCDWGTDVTHPDFSGTLSDGTTTKIVDQFDFEASPMAPKIVAKHSHGTCCSSAATSLANNNKKGVAGVAGDCQLMAIQIDLTWGNEVKDADIFQWVAGIDPQNGAFPALPANGADVISNSWGRPGNLSVVIAAVIDEITTYGRQGRGTLLFFSAGNSRTPTLYETERPNGTHQKSMAVAASTLDNTGQNEIHATYSNLGAGIELCAPSHDVYPIVHNPTASYGAFTATHSPNSASPLAQTTVTAVPAPAPAPANSISVASTAGFRQSWDVVIGALGNANSERFTITSIGAGFLTLNRPWTTAPSLGNQVLMLDGNCPGNIVSNTALTAATIVGTNTIQVNNAANFTAGNAVLIGNPGVANTEAHAIQQVAVITNTVTLMSNILNVHPVGVQVNVGVADYKNNFGGTSYATPISAGIAALCISANPNLSWVEVRDIMRHTGQKINIGDAGTAIGGVNFGKWRDKNGQDIVNSVGTLVSLVPQVVSSLSALNANRDVLSLASVANFETGQAVVVTGGGNTEFRVIRSVNSGANTLTLDGPLINVFPTPGTTAEAGLKPHYSAFYGFGRVHAGNAVQAALDSVNNFRQLLIRDNLTDNGTAASASMQSPDIWVGNSNLITNSATYSLKRVAVGIDDFVFNQNYSGNQNAEFYIEIDGTGATDTFAWRLDNGPLTAGVAITGAAQVLANGFSIQFGATTGHKLEDNWTVYIDLTEPALDYTKDAPHENPKTGNNRFIHARIKNVVTGALAAQYKNLDAWVRFYIALSPGKTANANAQGAGFTSNFFFSSNGNNNDWADNNAIGTITGGVVQTYFLGEVEVPEGVIEPSDNADPNKGNYVVSVPWNQADIPPVGTVNSIYLLVHIAPFHGPVNGSGAHNNSCLAYREIAFADFLFKDHARTKDLVEQMQVEAFGSAKTQDFSVDIEQHIGNFLTEKLRLEVTRVNDNGTEEKAIYLHDGANWTFDGANPQWPGLTINPPVVTGSAGAAAGLTNKVSFQGNVQAAKEHLKVIFRPQIISQHSNEVIATDVHEIDVMEQVELPTGIDPASIAAPPPPKSYAFADMANLTQTSAQAFGPVSGQEVNQFAVTSLFTANTYTNAYAITSGITFLQPGADPDTLNLVLRPFKQTVVGFTPIKYFIYRGLRKADFLDGTDTTKIVTEDPANSEFIKRQREIHKDQNDPGTDFLSKALGYDPATQNVDDALDAIFYKNNPEFQLPFATKGMQIGRYYHQDNHEFGLEIVLEEGTFEVDLAYVQKRVHIVDVPALPSETDAQKFDKKLKREEILNFIDPAAFYGMHMANKGTVETRKADGSTENKKGQDIYTDVVSKFHTKNKVYLDIRSENGDSYNFYGNYKGPATDPDLGKNIQIGTEFTDATTNNLVSQQYKTYDWPVIIEDRMQNVAGDVNLLYLRLRIDDNVAPLIYVEEGKPKIAASVNISPNFIDNSQLGALVTDTPVWTNKVGFDLVNTGPTNAKHNVATVIKFYYNRILPFVGGAWPTSVLKTETTTDNVFGPVNLDPHWNTDRDIKWVTAQDKKFVDFSTTWGYMAERGIAFDAFSDSDPNVGRVVCFGVANEYFLSPAAAFEPAQGITGGVSSKGTFFEVAGFFQDLKLSFDLLIIGGTKITTLQLVPTSGKALPPNSILLLCLSRKELDSLKALAGFHSEYPRYVDLEEVADTTDDNGKTFKKYKLKIQGLDSNGQYKEAAPATDIFVYSVDSFLFFSDDYSKDEPLPNTYNRDAEENIGALVDTGTGKAWEDVFIENDSKAALAGVNEKAPKLVQDFINDVKAVTNDANAKANLETQIDNHVVNLLKRMRAYAVDSNNNEADDRILYWSRVKMKVALQSHEYLLQSFKDRNELLQHFEVKSRGYDDIDFSPAGTGIKKVLVTGFDPCFLDPKGGLNHNVLNSNPSGAAALALHGQFITEGINNVAYVQSVVFPVRYADFDRDGGEGIIESFFNRFIDPTDPNYHPVDFIIVMDKFTPGAFMFGRFAARRRGQDRDNQFQFSAEFPLVPTGDEFYQTTLPVEKAIPAAPYPAGQDYYRYFSQTYEYRLKASNAVKNFRNDKREGPDNISDDPESIDPSNLLPTNQLQANIAAKQGSFDHYFANEVFYRLCVLREKKNGAVKAGALALPKIQGNLFEAITNLKISSDFDAALTKEVIDELKVIIKDLVV